MDAKQHERKAREQRIAVGENIVDSVYVVLVKAYDKARALDADPAAVELLEDTLENLHDYRRIARPGILTAGQLSAVGRK